ncbi:MAG TPA: neuromedin U [Polyangia bacterium]|nr:neuromedin U [Polyangia bacterium]
MSSTTIRGAALVAACLSVLALARRAAAEAQQEKDQPSDQADEDKHTGDLAKAVQNPIADLISVPFQNNASYNIGTNDRAADTLNIQPVIPTHLGDHVLLVSRIILPVSYQPTLTSTGGGTSGVGDLNPTFFFSPAHPGKLIWGAGPAFVLPTATQQAVGTGKWSAGPSAVVLMQPDPWTIGVLASQVWSFAGPTNRSDVSLLTVQYFVSYNLAHAWYLTSSPILTFNWKAPSSDEWLVPFGGGIGKIFKLGKLPLNGAVQAFYNVHSSDATTLARWQARVQLTFLFPAAGSKPKPTEKEGDDSRSAARATPAAPDFRFTGVPGDLSLAVEPRHAP